MGKVKKVRVSPLSRQIRDDKHLSITLLSILVSLYLTNYISIAGMKYAALTEYSSYVKYIPFICLLFNGWKIITKLDVKILLWLSGIGCLYFISYLIFQNESLVEYFEYFITICMPGFILIYQIHDDTYFMKYLRMFAIAATFAGGALIWIIISMGKFENEYYMGFSNISALFAVVLFGLFVETKKQRHFIYFIVSVITILITGSRGALISLAFFVVVYIYSNKSWTSMEKLAAMMLIICLAVFYQEIFEMMYNICKKMNINSRTLYLMSSDVKHMSGREDIYGDVWKSICESPLAVRGIAYDMEVFETYPHNIAFELLYQFGVLVGGPMICWIFAKAMKQISGATKKDDKLVLILIASGIMSLIFSNTLWKSIYFWLWIGYSVKKRGCGYDNITNKQL